MNSLADLHLTNTLGSRVIEVGKELSIFAVVTKVRTFRMYLYIRLYVLWKVLSEEFAVFP